MPQSNNPEVSRQSAWRPQDGGQRRQSRLLFAKRLSLSVLLCGLIWGLVALIANPLRAPGTQLVLLSASSVEQTGHVRMPPFVTADFESLTAIAPVLRRTASEDTRVYSPEPLKTPAQLQRIGAECDARIDNTTDVVILYLRATGTIVDGQPQLTWEFDRQWTNEETLPVKDVLQLLSERPCATKLLILDCHSVGWELENGTLVNNFMTEVEKLVQARHDPSLWVMTSRADFESAYYSRSLGQTVFGKVLSEALAGSADHDADLSISLTELFRYVNQHTADWIGRRTARQLSQTPQLFHAGGINWKRSPELLSLSRRYVPPENDEPQPEPAADPEQASPPAQAEVANRILKTLLTPSLASQGLAFLVFAGPDEETQKTEPPPDTPDAQPTAGDSQASPAAESSAKSEEVVAPAFASDVANPAWATLLEVWSKRDALSAGHPSPAEFAPHIWRLLEMKILEQQAAILYGNEEESASAARNLTTQLAESASLPNTTEAAGDLIRQLASQWPTESVTEMSASLAAREFLETIGARRQSDQEKKLLAEFQLLLDGDSPGDVQSWLRKQTAQEEFVELRLAQQIVGTSDISWGTAVDLLELRMKAETAAASASFCRGRLEDAMERADRLRLEPERQLLYGVAASTPADSAALIAQADEAYADILAMGQLLRNAESVARELLYQVPGRIADFRIQSTCRVMVSPDFGVLRRHLRQLRDLLRHIYTTAPLAARGADQLRALLADVTESHRVLTTTTNNAIAGVPKNGPIDTVMELRIRHYVDSTLPTAELRNHLLTALETIESQTREPPSSTSQRIRRSSVPDDMWVVIEQHAQLEVLRCELMVCRQSHPEVYIEPLRKAYDEAVIKSQATANDAGKAAIWNKEFGGEVLSVHSRVANRLTETFASAARSFGRAVMDECLSFEPALFLLPTPRLRQLELPVSISLASLRSQSVSKNASRLQRQRVLLARDDAPAIELRQLSADLSRLNDTSGSQPEIRVNVAAEVPLNVGQTLELPVQIHNQSASTVFVQLTIEYDESNLAVAAAPGFRVFTASTVRAATRTQANEARRSLNNMIRQAFLSTIPDEEPQNSERQLLRKIVQRGHYPIRAASVSTDPTLTLAAGETRTVPLKITGLKFSRQPSQIVLRVEAPTQYLRFDVTARVPTPRIAEPVLTGVPGTCGDSEAVRSLNPFPNALTSYTLALRCLSDVGTDVDLQILHSTRAVESIPQYAVGKPEADALLSKLGASVIVASTEPVTLTPGSDQPIVLKAPEAIVPEDAPAESPTPGGAAAQPAQSLNHGLILKLTEGKTQLVSLFHLPITVQHPRRYLETHATYVRSESRFSLTIAAPDFSALPDGDVPLTLDFDPPLSTGPVRTVLNRKRGESLLWAAIPTDRVSECRAILSISDYPSAFAWRIDGNQSGAEIAEDDKTLAIRILSPYDGEAWQTPVETIPVALQITAPPGFPSAFDDRIQVGIDTDRDREFHGESVVDLSGTHRVDVVWNGVTEDGGFTLRSSVGHMTINIPAGDIGSQNVNLLARITDGRTVSWSRPVPVTFDGTKPVLSNLAVAPAEFQAEGHPLKIVVRATDGELSGVAQVNSGFVGDDPERFLESAPTGTLEPSARGLWTGDLPTAGLIPGTHTVAVQAVDHAGNASSLSPMSVLIVSAQEAERRAAEVTNVIRGTVLYGGMPVPQAMVSLKTGALETDPAAPETQPPAPGAPATAPPAAVQTDELGNFTIKDVRVGKYVLTAESLVRGLRRVRSFDIEVSPPPARIRQDVELR